MRYLSILLISLTTSGCATLESQQDRMKRTLDASIGLTKKQVITTVGPPTSEFDIDENTTAYTWLYDGNSSSETTFMKSYLSGGVRAVTNTSQNNCKITLFLNKVTNLVESYRWQGRGC